MSEDDARLSGDSAQVQEVGGYRSTHLDADHARRYDTSFFSAPSANALNWQTERRLLDLVFQRHLERPRQAVDFACGTGRVLSYLEQRVDETVGIDISAQMLALARPHCPRSRLIQRDVTTAQGDDILLPPVDLVTAFRFFLNAEDDLRAGALAWMRTVLRPGGTLVANFHLNPTSLRGAYLRLRWAGRRRNPMLAPTDVAAMLSDAGFDVLARYGYDYLPYRRDGASLRGVSLRRRVENALVDRPRLAGLGGSFLVVATPR